jgi:putative MATE family efflux protein
MNNSDFINQPIRGILFRLAIPAAMGHLFNTLYQIVDTYYAGIISADAIAAISLSYPIFFVILAVGYGFSTGGTALIANELGKNNKEKARLYAGQLFSLSIILALFLTIGGLKLAPLMLTVLGATNDYLNISLSYLNVIICGTIFFILVLNFSAVLNARGDTKTYRNFLIVGFSLNLILNPVLMFGWIGLPALKFQGIALATVIIQLIGTLYLGSRIAKEYLFHKGFLSMLVPKKEFLDLIRQGLPAAFNMMTMSINLFTITYYVSYFGKENVAAFGIGSRIESISFLAILGLNIATLSIVGRNNGAGRMDRVAATLKLVQKYGFIWVSISSTIYILFATSLIGLFTSKFVVISVGAGYLRFGALMSWAYVLLLINVSALQGMKKPSIGLWVSLYRHIIAPNIVFYLLTRVFAFGVEGIWIGLFMINWTGAIFIWFYTRRIIRKAQSLQKISNNISILPIG